MDRRRLQNIFDVVLGLPWWASLVAAVVVFILLKYVVPALVLGSHFLGVVAGGLKRAAPYVAILLLAIAPAAYLRRLFRRRFLDGQTDLDSLCAMSWPQFELLVGDGFQRLGYSVEEKGGAAQDDRIDLVLRKDDVTTLVQCKQWRAKQVDVIGRARGAFGASADYLERTRVALISHGIVDPYLEDLAARLLAANALRRASG